MLVSYSYIVIVYCIIKNGIELYELTWRDVNNDEGEMHITI